MTFDARATLRVFIARWVGERPIPIGGVAADRRLIRRALAGRVPGRVLVVGPGLAARQALKGVKVDVAGTSPHSSEVNVCSSVRGATSLPADRWDTVIISAPADLRSQLEAIRPACHRPAQILVIDRTSHSTRSVDPLTVQAELGEASALRRGRRRAWIAAVPA